MSDLQINLIALEIPRWDLETQKVNLKTFFMVEEKESDINFDVTIMQPPEMVEEFIGKLRVECEKMLKNLRGDESLQVLIDNEAFIRQKIYNYFKRITSELNNPRRKKGQPKMIFTTHMDIYNENQDVSFLPQPFRLYVVLNWCRKYYEKEDFKKAVEPLRKLIKDNPQYGQGYLWLARSLKKIRKYDEAMRYYEKYAEVEGTTDAWLELAKSYRKGKIFDKSEEIYLRILKKEPENREARIGHAQILYANNSDDYLPILDKLYAEDPQWCKEWLNNEFNFRIYITEKTLLSPVQAAKFLGFRQIFELTQRAFKNEIPSHFNPSKARISFYREELEKWSLVMNRFHCQEQEIELHPEKVHEPLETGMAEPEETVAGGGSGIDKEGGKSLTKVEEILRHIRARKAARKAEQQLASAEDGTNSAGPDLPVGAGGGRKSGPAAGKQPRTAKGTANATVRRGGQSSGEGLARGSKRKRVSAKSVAENVETKSGRPSKAQAARRKKADV